MEQQAQYVRNYIKEWRELCGLTQEELAEKMGYKSKTAVQKVETLGNSLTSVSILRYAKALAIHPADLFCPPETADVRAEINRHLRLLNEQQLKSVAVLVKDMADSQRPKEPARIAS